MAHQWGWVLVEGASLGRLGECTFESRLSIALLSRISAEVGDASADVIEKVFS
jgi:hypothetical protein